MNARLEELEPCGPSGRRPGAGADREPPRWTPRRVTAVLAVVAAAVTGVSLAQGDPPADPAEQAARRLAEVVAFVEGERSFGFDIDYYAGRSAGSDNAITSLTEGAVGPRGTARWSETSGGSVSELIDLGNVVYRRSGQPDTVEDTQWTAAMADEGFPPAPGAGVSVWALPSTVVNTPLFARLTDNDFARLLKAVRSPREVTTHTWDGPPQTMTQGVIPLSALYRDIPEGFVGQATAEITAGPGGRLNRLRLSVTTRRDTIGADGRQSRVNYAMTTDVRFEGWGSAGLVTAPPLRLVDLTPGVDEGAVTDLAWTVLAPSQPPAGFELASLHQRGGDCPVIFLEYHPSAAADGGFVGGSLNIEQQARECSGPVVWNEWADLGPPRPFAAGRFRGVIRQGPEVGTDGAERPPPYSEVHFDADGARFNIYSYLDLPELEATLATMAPIDFATQPVRMVEPPRS